MEEDCDRNVPAASSNGSSLASCVRDLCSIHSAAIQCRGLRLFVCSFAHLLICLFALCSCVCVVLECGGASPCIVVRREPTRGWGGVCGVGQMDGEVGDRVEMVNLR